MPFLIIVSGLTCTGKTTLSKRIAQELGLPLVNKDGIKELLFDHVGWSDRAWSQQLGRASIELLYYFAETQLAVGRSLVIESNFDPKLATPRFLAMKEKYGFIPFQIQCQTEGKVLLQRFKDRAESGERHPGHVDHLNYPGVAATLRQGPLAHLAIGGQVIELDTTDFQKIDYAGLMAALRVAAAACDNKKGEETTK